MAMKFHILSDQRRFCPFGTVDYRKEKRTDNITMASFVRNYPHSSGCHGDVICLLFTLGQTKDWIRERVCLPHVCRCLETSVGSGFPIINLRYWSCRCQLKMPFCSLLYFIN